MVEGTVRPGDAIELLSERWRRSSATSTGSIYREIASSSGNFVSGLLGLARVATCLMHRA